VPHRLVVTSVSILDVMGEHRRVTEKVTRLRGVTWKWRDDAPAEAREQAGMGVIAQEVEAVFPDLVVTGEDGRKRVDYVGLAAPLIEAIKELDARVLALEARLQTGDASHAHSPSPTPPPGDT
jgi:Chaperone of endosialidase